MTTKVKILKSTVVKVTTLKVKKPKKIKEVKLKYYHKITKTTVYDYRWQAIMTDEYQLEKPK